MTTTPASPLTFPPMAELTSSMAEGEYARARYCLTGLSADEGLRSFVILTQRLTRVQQNGFLADRDVAEHLWAAAESSGIVGHHGADTVQNVMAAAIEKALADPDDRASAAVTARATKSIRATSYTWREPGEIPQREWLYDNLLIRKFLSATVAQGGVGKSALVTAEALAHVSGKPLLGIPIKHRLREWIWNLEDPQDETVRRIQAAAQHHHLSEEDLGDRLFVDSGRDQRLVITTTTRNNTLIAKPVVDSLIGEILTHKIDVIVIDPFVSCHTASENDNTAMDMIAKEWGRVADAGNCAVHLIHHTRKLGNNETEVTVESARGARALVDACRVVRAINRMTDQEGKDSGIDNHRLYFRSFNDKANLAPPADRSVWFKIEGVWLGNGPLGQGDNVGVVTSWEWPSMLSDITTDDLRRVQKKIAEGNWREDSKAKNWAGNAVAEVVGIDMNSSPSAKAKVKSLLRIWIENGALRVVRRGDDSRHERPFIEVGKWLD